MLEADLLALDAPLGVYPWHAEVFDVWVGTWRTWRWLVGMTAARRVGLDFQQVESVLRLQGIKRKAWPAIFRQLRTMESAALEVLAEREK